MDIENREDIEKLMRVFYAKAIPDEIIGHYFTEVIQMDLEQHLPVIIDFWETVLFGVARYKSNAIAVHQQLHAKSAFTDQHFERWVNLFQSTIDELFSGDKAELAKQRALSIATVMKIKTIHGELTINTKQ
ncbi:group III truncated hemoglobin [Sediminibacterium sp.]|uniref:group III truncated hemoglobin n=1 Tax=Sediminibacterium sp. TaxID=1917865 RepID=UPI0025E86F5E|nr:group III truncated hemoglobin [Sediminibacterium sp.]MBW0176819.1 group III truncated hemoglobin [Sediminibacterium sp.]